MKYRNYFIAIFFVLAVIDPFALNAQMKSCCEPDGAILVSTVKQSAGTLKMVKILDSISKNANPEDFYLMRAQGVLLPASFPDAELAQQVCSDPRVIPLGLSQSDNRIRREAPEGVSDFLERRVEDDHH